MGQQVVGLGGLYLLLVDQHVLEQRHVAPYRRRDVRESLGVDCFHAVMPGQAAKAPRSN